MVSSPPSTQIANTMQTVDIVALRQQFSEFLKEKMYRNTQERFKVLERIALLDKHISADELYVAMNNLGDKVSRATVYSTLDLLTRCNIIVKHRFQGDRAMYELSSRKPHHDHLLCVDCGRIVEFDGKELDSVSKEIAHKFGFVAMSHSFQIFAQCADQDMCPNR